MGWDKAILQQEHIARMLSHAERVKHGVQTSSEAREKAAVRDERELQNQIASLLRLRGIWYDHDAMHRKRTGTKGAPDFQFAYRGRYVGWECKPPWDTELDPDQKEARRCILEQFGVWRLITSVDEALAHLREMNEL